MRKSREGVKRIAFHHFHIIDLDIYFSIIVFLLVSLVELKYNSLSFVNVSTFLSL